RKAIIVRQEQLVAGITVDEIFDVTYVHPSQLNAAPVAVHSVSDEYLQGVASYQEKMMSVINLPKVLHSGALVVNEEV
ncbi:MAG TPA: chemotaxis protein CheW, partial [Allocoleopsis sp.]